MSRGSCVLIGSGPGLGAAYARAFHVAGYDLALISRSGARPEGAPPDARIFAADAGDPGALRQALEMAEEELGGIDVVIYNADLALFGTLDEISAEDFEQSWRVSALGLFVVAKHVAAGMESRGGGAIVVTGATGALRGNVWTTAFAAGKAAQRNLAQSLAKQLGPKGVHVAYLVIDGVIDTADTRAGFAKGKPDAFFLKPDRIAEAALAVVRQDPSAWTFELDLRPFGERW